MGVPGSASSLLFSSQAADDYVINRSLRFGSANSKLTKTFGSAGDRKLFTISFWVKRSNYESITTSDDETILKPSDGSNTAMLDFTDSSSRIRLYDSSTSTHIISRREFRDVSAWYHCLIRVNTAAATEANRVLFYVNGVQETSFHQAAYPAQNGEMTFNKAADVSIGNDPNNSAQLNAYLAEFNFVDGASLPPTSFGKFNSDGIWVPIDPSVSSYGSNGYRLDFSDNSSTSALGTDTSGQSNNFTTSGFSLSGTNNDSVVDSPAEGSQTDTGAGGELSSTYCNFLLGSTTDNYTSSWPFEFSDGLLKAKKIGSTFGLVTGTIPFASGKFYFEYKCTTGQANSSFGICSVNVDTTYDYASTPLRDVSSEASKGFVYRQKGGIVNMDGSTTTATVSVLASGDVVGIAVDKDNNTVKFYKDGTLETTVDISGSPMASSLVVPLVEMGTNNKQIIFNAGSQPFIHSAPTGYKSLCTANLATPTIADGSQHFTPFAWTGNGSGTRTFGVATGDFNFKPNWALFKNASDSVPDHPWTAADNVGGNFKRYLNDDGPSTSSPRAYLSEGTYDLFLSDSPSSNAENLNDNGSVYAAWLWNAGANSSKTYAVTVAASGGSNYFYIDANQKPVLELEEGSTYTFDQSDSSNSGHPLRFSTTANGTHAGGAEYTTGVTTNGTPGQAGAFTRITIAAGAPRLYYYCSNHSNMGAYAETRTISTSGNELLAGASNFDGSEVSVVRANPEAGFSIVRLDLANNSTATYGHGLNAKPEMIVVDFGKDNLEKYIYHKDLGNNKYVNWSAGQETTGTFWNNTTPTNSVFSLKSNDLSVSGPYNDAVAMVFAPVESYSAFGTYTGNGDDLGPFIMTGFKPSFVMIKPLAMTGEYSLFRFFDIVREPINRYFSNVLKPTSPKILQTDSGGSRDWYIDFLSNGFRIRADSAGAGEYGNTDNKDYIWAAWASNPFKGGRAH